MRAKKAKAKGKPVAKTPAKKGKPKTQKSVDMVQVRENINNLVGESAEEIATEVIKVALTGQLATAKYLFEAVGLYPPTEETTAVPIETSLAHTLLTRMGLPLEPVIRDEDSVPAAVSAAKSIASKTEELAEEDSGTEREEEEEADSAEDKE